MVTIKNAMEGEMVTIKAIVTANRQHDAMYFDVTEQRTLKYPDVTAGKILHEEAAIEEHEKTIPGNYGVTNAMAATAGKYTLHDVTVAVVAHSTDSLPAPSPEEELPDAPDIERPLPDKKDVVIYRQRLRLDGRREKRAHEGILKNPSATAGSVRQGLTERAGGIFQDILYKEPPDDTDANRAMRMRKATATVFHEADCDQDLHRLAAEEPREKRSHVELLEMYHMSLTMHTTLAKRRKKEARLKDFKGDDGARVDRAILKEVNNNLETSAYKILSSQAQSEAFRSPAQASRDSDIFAAQADAKHKLGTNQKEKGCFTGKDISLQPDGSMLIQEFYVKEKVSDLIECNKIIDEAIQQSKLGIRVMPIDWKDLRVSVVTDAAWGNLTYEISFGSRTPRPRPLRRCSLEELKLRTLAAEGQALSGVDADSCLGAFTMRRTTVGSTLER
ncbi:hypothetical protein AK812_SmicGene30337 [Symbiodinium microadriaticum]|uniref:Uncharacterized protein n=1 Tax=Symbiodinium microadriaticum TaxID=2951 RepID=A0A1Q9CZK8_SYMMI|nr:hypothetical protein AK812_SmicGene30337 [Symbiodinium microadriaticum]